MLLLTHILTEDTKFVLNSFRNKRQEEQLLNKNNNAINQIANWRRIWEDKSTSPKSAIHLVLRL